jgi:hypothetical protein
LHTCFTSAFCKKKKKKKKKKKVRKTRKKNYFFLLFSVSLFVFTVGGKSATGGNADLTVRILRTALKTNTDFVGNCAESRHASPANAALAARNLALELAHAVERVVVQTPIQSMTTMMMINDDVDDDGDDVDVFNGVDASPDERRGG